MVRTAVFVLAALAAGATHTQAASTDATSDASKIIGDRYTTLPFHTGGRSKNDSGDLGPTDDPSDIAEHFPQTGPKIAHQWPGTYFTAAFSGDTVYFRFDDASNNYRITVGRDPPFELKRPGKMVVKMTGFSHHNHVVRVEKLSESMSAPGTFEGFFLPRGETALPPPIPARQVELIGDSYAAGYGTTSTRHECTPDEIRDTTDTQQAFGALVGKHYDADYQVNAVSGIGMVRNYDDSAGEVMPALYPYTLFDKSVIYDDPSWNPQVVVVALGDNDFATPVKPGGKWADDAALTADFVATYVRFVKDARKTHPRATFILMDYGEPALIPALAQIAAQLKQDGDTRILTWSAGTGFEQTGCDWHLSLNDHQRIAAGLEALIDAQTGIWDQ